MKSIEELIEEAKKQREELIKRFNMQVSHLDGKIAGLTAALELSKLIEATPAKQAEEVEA